MSYTNTTGDDEEILLKNLVLKVENLLPGVKNFDREIFVESKGDFVRKLMVVPDAKKEVRYVCFTYLGYTDDDTEGDDDCPVCILIYRVRLFFQFVDTRPNDSNSAREFTKATLTLRKDFLESREIPSTEPASARKGVIDDLTPEGFAFLGIDDLTGITGHALNYLLRVKHYGN